MQRMKKRPDGRYRCKYKDKYFYGSTQQEALRAKERYIDSLKAGLKAGAGSVTVRHYSAKWLPVHKVGIRKATYNSYARYIDSMNEIIGDMTMQSVTPTDIKSVYNKYIGMSESSIKKVKFLITAVFESAVRDGIIRVNPCIEVSPHKGTSGSHRAITDEERKLILNTPAKFRLPVLVMLYAGLRRGEVLALDMKDIDLKKKVIHVTEAVYFEGNKRMIDSPKTEAGIRDVPIFPILEKELDGHKGLIAGKEYSETGFTRAWEAYVNTLETAMNGCQKRWYGRRKEDKEKNPAKYAKVLKLEAEAEKLKSAGRKAEAKQKKEEADKIRLEEWKYFTVRPHDLRHSFVTMLCDAKVEIDLAMQWCGHGDERMIRQIYDHVTSFRTERAIADVTAVIKEAHS